MSSRLFSFIFWVLATQLLSPLTHASDQYFPAKYASPDSNAIQRAEVWMKTVFAGNPCSNNSPARGFATVAEQANCKFHTSPRIPGSGGVDPCTRSGTPMPKKNEARQTCMWVSWNAVYAIDNDWVTFLVAPAMVEAAVVYATDLYQCPLTPQMRMTPFGPNYGYPYTCICPDGDKLNPGQSGCTGSISGNGRSFFDDASTPPKQCLYGHPIDPMTGAKVKTMSLGLEVGGRPLVLRYDTSILQRQADSSNFPEYRPTGLPNLWDLSLVSGMSIDSDGYSARISNGVGGVSNFSALPGPIQTGGGNTYASFTPAGFTGTSGNGDSIGTPSGDLGGYIWSVVNGTTGETSKYHENGDGTASLMSVTDATGHTLTYSYNNSQLAYVRDSLTGRSIHFQYQGALITSISDSSNRKVTFAYDAAGNLSTIQWQDGKTHTFLYENTSFPWAMTGELDENNVRWSTYGYDSAGRAISTQLTGGVDSYAANFATVPSLSSTTTYDPTTMVSTTTRSWAPPTGLSMTLPNGQTSTVGTTSVAGRNMVTSQSQPAGSGCAAANSASTFDANGNLTSQDDFQGQRVCYAYDTKNREIARVEGLSTATDCATVLPVNATVPANARKVSTAWHTDWKMATQVTAPGTITSSIYQGQPDPFNANTPMSCTTAPNLPNGKPMPLLCKQMIQATLPNGSIDAAIPVKANLYTYDALGQLLNSTDELGHISTFSYYNGTVMNGVLQEPVSTSLLMHADGANGATTFVDSSTSMKTLTAFGNAKTSTVAAKFGSASASFDGGTSYISASASDDTNFQGSDFTVETWVNLNALPASGGYMALVTDSWESAPTGAARVWFFGIENNAGVATIHFAFTPEGSNGGLTDINTPIPGTVIGTWNHVAAVRSGNTLSLYVNGVASTSIPMTAAIVDTPQNVSIGVANPDWGISRWFLNGYLDEIRITKGVARYGGNFSVQTAAFLDGANVQPEATGHTVGDLASITNAAGQVTTFDLYDPVGHILQTTDPKGVVTAMTYTPRGWISTVSVTAPGGVARTTSYGYDAVGQLTGVTNPDGSTLGFSYDAAHRLVGATDSRGNTVAYTLDNVGNRISEQVKDPSGNLQRSIARSFDALNRVQQVSGATQ